ATYFAAGSLRTRFWTFAGYFVIASLLWTPLLVGSTVVFGDQLLRVVFAHNHRNTIALATTWGAIGATYASRRRAFGLLERIVQWEFWPPWVAYIPLLPYLAYLAIRHRSLMLFTAANPAIPSGGFVGESKSMILSQLGQVTGSVADFQVIPAELELQAKLH